MKKTNGEIGKTIQNVFRIRKIFISLLAMVICIWAFFQNKLFAKVIISPFIICSIAMFFENIFLLLNKEKTANIFKYIFRISFFAYVFGFLAYIVYYAFAHKSYSFLIGLAIFLPFVIHFFRKSFFNKNNKS